MSISGPPVPITAAHATGKFDCGDPALDRWLHERALTNHVAGYTRVRVLIQDDSIVGFYGLAAASIAPDGLPRTVRGGQPPDPIPAFLISRLAVDRQLKGRGLGADLLRHAIVTCMRAAELIGSRLIMVHAANPMAADFYAHYDFRPTRSDPLLLVQALQPLTQAGR